MSAFPHLLSPIAIRGLELKNRIVSTGHHTHLTGDIPSERLAAYHEARARGGTGLIIIEIASVHPTAYFSPDCIDASNPACTEGYARVAEACHAHGAKVFAQLFHPGREIKMSPDGTTPVAHSASAIPNERFHLMPKAMPKRLIAEVVRGYGRAAAHIEAGGIDGVEIVASHGYLPSQFLSPRVNTRSDRYGGSFDNRLRFVREVVRAIREATRDLVLGLRISGDEMGPGGLTPAETTEICSALDADGELDYYSVVAGSSESLGSSVHIVPPMMIEHGYIAPLAAGVRRAVSKPVIVTGRINQPQIAERVLAAEQADLCGMTRALICDPQMPCKTVEGRLDDIRACIACNQACIGHSHTGHPISCIQHPETGRELVFGTRARVSAPRRILVAGGGPAGMKAAAVAGERGHRVTLYESGPRLGGQALLAQLLPGRAEFGGIVTNLARELELAGVEVVLNTPATPDLVDRERPDAVIVATGAAPRVPEVEAAAEGHVVNAWEVLRNEANVGQSVVIADWRCDWVGMGLAERFARDGCQVKLCVNGYMPGQSIQQYTRDHWLGTLHKLGVTIIPMARLFGVDADTAYFQHTASGEPILCEGVDTLVLALGSESVCAFEDALAGLGVDVLTAGDCVCPRTAEEAVLEGLKAGVAV